MHFRRLAKAPCYPTETVECLDDNAASEFVSGSLAAGAISRVETHLAGCRDCRQLVAALAGDEADSQALTHKHEKIAEESPSQVAKRPVLSIGDRVGRYLVLATLGAGGMGVVFTAYDPQLDRKVALKLLRANLGVNAKEARTRLKREAQAIAQLNHPNVVGVYDVGTTDGGDVYIAMEFVEGDTLTSWLKKWPRTWREILDVFHQAGRGLMAAHSVGLLHRDFKPDNVLVGGDGRVRVTDFGLARSVFLDDSTRGSLSTAVAQAKAHPDGSPLHVDLTATGTILGTPRYMPPEQLTGPTIDSRADQFSFCVALYEALYNTHPLKGSTSMAMLESGEKAISPPESKGVPSQISRAVMRGLEQERQRRFPTMSALMQELTPPPQRSPMKFIAVAAVGALLVTGATAAVITSRRPEPIQRIEPHTEQEIRLLYEEMQKKNKLIEELQAQLGQQRIQSGEELEEVKQRLDAALDDTKKLQDEIIKLRAKQVANSPLVAAITSKQVTEAIQAVRSSISVCLGDVDGRVLSTEGAPKNRQMDAAIRLSTTPSGTAFDVEASGLEYSPAATLCVEDALKRVAYPKGTDILEIQVAISWKAGTLAMTANVVRQHEPAGSNLNGI
jgi:serine/threonine protein kinase